jgi:glycosyltransferase involved in cell wall biosynthesis
MSFISFVIPAQNEARFIQRDLRSIHTYLKGRQDYEIIVVDNASTDETAALAEAEDAQVISVPYKTTPAKVRNIGVAQAKGDVLVFLDGDIYLTDQWIDRFESLLPEIRANKLVTGSTLDVDPEASWIAKAWFGPLFERQDVFVNGGHLMMSRSLFDQIGGFDETLETGEDTEICLRAQRNGAMIRCDKQLHAVHMGYPNDLGHFFRRERWHRKGNFQSWKQITSSKIPALVLLHALSFFVALLLPIVTGEWRWLLVYPVVALTLSFAGAFKWLGGFAPNFLACMFLSWWYLTARAFSFSDVFWLKIRQKIR